MVQVWKIIILLLFKIGVEDTLSKTCGIPKTATKSQRSSIIDWKIEQNSNFFEIYIWDHRHPIRQCPPSWKRCQSCQILQRLQQPQFRCTWGTRIRRRMSNVYWRYQVTVLFGTEMARLMGYPAMLSFQNNMPAKHFLGWLLLNLWHWQ